MQGDLFSESPPLASDISFRDLFPDRSVVILDGGFGSTLETDFGINISHTPLWSAHAITEHPSRVIEAHLAFLNAGADVILTSTYQCSFNTFRRAGFNDDAAKLVMRKAVLLAHKAREKFEAENQGKKSRIGLSLGPFGASLSPTQEFEGFYPPPFGPKGHHPTEQNVAKYDEQERDAERQSIEQLADFHFERLLVFLEDRESWDAIDCICFETVPLLREVSAIRMAMGRLRELMQEGKNGKLNWKPWWISAVFPGGVIPELANGGTTDLSMDSFILAAFTGPDPTPAGIGINCTSIQYLPTLVESAQCALASLATSKRPWIVLYPNGGGVYDVVSQTWSGEGDLHGQEWTKILGDLGARTLEARSWGGLIAGGCCRVSPVGIRQLAALFNTEKKEGK